jgi:hypothetical protein
MRRWHYLTLAAKALLCVVVSGIGLVPAEGYGQEQYVRPIDWTRYAGKTGVRQGDSFGQTLTTVLQNTSRYELNWLHNNHAIRSDVAGWEGVECYWPDFNSPSVYIEAERPLGAIVYSTAVQIKTGIYSPTVAGLSVAEAIRRTERAIRGVAFTNVVNAAPGATYKWGWGLGSRPYSIQSHVAGAYGAWTADAAWMLWDQLGSDTKHAVARMVEREANTLASEPPLYWANRNGTIIYPGDSQMEENAWNGHMLAVAQTMMPNHPNAAMWRQRASEYQVATCCRQSDLSNATMVDGKPVKDWLGGYNVFNDGILVNHGLVHPDYITCDQFRHSSMIDVSLAGQYITQSMTFNADLAYRALTEVQLTPGTNPYGTGSLRQPGGTLYRRTSGGGYDPAIYYPNGNDWPPAVPGTYLPVDGYLNMDLIAEHLGFDAGKNFDAMGWAQVRLAAMQQLQNRPGHDGNVFVQDDFVNPVRDPDECLLASTTSAWMQWWMMQNNLYSPVSDRWGALPTPEPSSAMLAIIALLGAGTYARRKPK